MSVSESKSTTRGAWMELHFPVLLYGWFWLGMMACGLLAPAERVALLESSLVTEGWHLSLMCLLFGGPIVGAYVWRMRHTAGD